MSPAGPSERSDGTSPLDVHGEVRELLPGLSIVVVRASGLDSPRGAAAARRRWAAAWDGVPPLRRPQDHPRIHSWRTTWARLGISRKKHPPSVEALLRRALRARETGSPPFRVSPVVDFYNALSLEHLVPAGAFDLADLGAGFELRLSRPGDTFRALGEPEASPVDEGEIVYATGSTVLTRHLVWRQSEEAAIRPETRDAVFVSEILPALDPGIADEVRSELVSVLERDFGARVESRILD